MTGSPYPREDGGATAEGVSARNFGVGATIIATGMLRPIPRWLTCVKPAEKQI